MENFAAALMSLWELAGEPPYSSVASKSTFGDWKSGEGDPKDLASF
ncbi:hypothetical protein GCM10023088_49690 [Actinomadura verrucosospora]